MYYFSLDMISNYESYYHIENPNGILTTNLVIVYEGLFVLNI